MGAVIVAAIVGILTAPVARGAAAPAAAPAALVKVSAGDAPALGPETAPVLIVEFGDFQCLFCARGSRVLRILFDRYPDKIRWAFKHFPLRGHRNSPLVHQAALAAHEQEKFWPFHELLYTNHGRHRMADLESYAAELGLDVPRFMERLHSPELQRRVTLDIQQGRVLGVFATPTYFINGRRVVGARSLAEFRELIEQELTAAAAAAVSSPETPK
jgi:protein-disulfide isomerase